MMDEQYKLMVARTLIKQKKIELLSFNNEQHLFLFRVNDSILVTCNYKGWICDYTEPLTAFSIRKKMFEVKGWNEPYRISHSLSYKEPCEHILACKMFLTINGLGQDSDDIVSNNSDLVEFGMPLTESPKTPKKKKKKVKK